MELKDLEELFKKEGTGIMATADKEGWVNMAIYSPPVVTPEDLLVFAATERLTYKNLKENPRAMFMYLTDEAGWGGARIRLYLTKDETSGAILEQLKERFERMGYSALALQIKHALYFRVEEIRPIKG